ncbi:MAG: hypothetical protein B7Y12_02115 [Rhizobiales bacterium 24-66-13]|jgi:repressor of nif and glnA expression|nr:MAG: hypothetical protein B7Z41_04080 [Rhizobiales bacterium 12-66-7]OYY88816.1 MAG: hypothetical protein B7Y61_01145 [Rhizobiales bacterium 35-66-30]OYZ82810.1 MAG: hypothetical protein B7Y12_02115 [Rhizobiales bacterium 24-66-13]OZB11843.1 MAG: hypothetical protein B7X67_02095 [Rhizobiales bacterium 39-66-18]HQS08732.1 hypothetical protein [Xanthobacteraceae bacterium]
MSTDQRIREEARLIILRLLSERRDETLNSNIIVRELAEVYGIDEERAWVHGEMEYLRRMGAVTMMEAATVKVATLTELGRRHIDRKVAIEGVKRPSRAED